MCDYGTHNTHSTRMNIAYIYEVAYDVRIESIHATTHGRDCT